MTAIGSENIATQLQDTAIYSFVGYESAKLVVSRRFD